MAFCTIPKQLDFHILLTFIKVRALIVSIFYCKNAQFLDIYHSSLIFLSITTFVQIPALQNQTDKANIYNKHLPPPSTQATAVLASTATPPRPQPRSLSALLGPTALLARAPPSPALPGLSPPRHRARPRPRPTAPTAMLDTTARVSHFFKV